MGLCDDGSGTGDGDKGVGHAGLVLVMAEGLACPRAVGARVDYSRELGWGR